MSLPGVGYKDEILFGYLNRIATALERLAPETPRTATPPTFQETLTWCHRHHVTVEFQEQYVHLTLPNRPGLLSASLEMAVARVKREMSEEDHERESSRQQGGRR